MTDNSANPNPAAQQQQRRKQAAPPKASARPRQPSVQTTPAAGSTGLGTKLRRLVRQTPSWLISMVVHTVVLLVMALITLPPPPQNNLRELVVAPTENEPLEILDQLDEQPLEPIDVTAIADANFESPIVQEELDVSPFQDLEAATVSVDLSDIGLDHAPKTDLVGQIGAFSGNAFSGRGAGKARLVAQAGGSEASEQAVARALQWIINHQLPDGSWSFNHQLAPSCRGKCRNPGELADARIGATAMALLPLLGAGQTHKTGKYKEQVRAGLYFLISNMKVTPQGGSLYEKGGRMYSHGLASIALCEAYGMTRDRALRAPAQQALNFICFAQDPVGGGWRYEPRQAGDTSVVGWQLMALKSGHMAYLHVPGIVIERASRFLDSVQSENGAKYGYTSRGAGNATTAIGLLCRMYLGWERDHPALQRGVKWLSNMGPDKKNMYYNYYATQIMRHMEGEVWKKWNAQMRDYLVNSQSTKGHEAGSWFFNQGHHDEKGGRLYDTAMATMILEVYYRHLPLYRRQSTEDRFPLD